MAGDQKKLHITFPNGVVSQIDEHVNGLIQDLIGKAKNPKKLPSFSNLSQSIEYCSDEFLHFYSYILQKREVSKSQLFQDLFVLFICGEKKGGTFLEFGATDGVNLSNSFMLESHFGWTGVLAEPSPRWHYDLRKNRPNSTIITDCVYSVTGEILDFFVSDYGELSTLNEFRQSDASGASSGNAELRNRSGYNHEVLSISLNDVFIKYFNSLPIDYMSVDTEGSELEILKNFDFPKFAPKLVTVEHNGTDAESKLDELFLANNYIRVFKDYTAFDAWYVHAN